MAVEAPAHRERRGLAHQRHLVDAAVAGRAADAFGDMDAVIEVDVVRKVMDAPPAQRPVLGEARRAPAPASRRWSRSANGRSCRSRSAECRRSAPSRPRCGSSGSRCRGARHGARWLNGTGCSRVTFWPVTYGERIISSQARPAARAGLPPTRITLAMASARGRKICAIPTFSKTQHRI